MRCMSTLSEALQLLSRMTPDEKAQLIQRAVLDLGGAHPGIDLDQRVCGGDACIVRTRIPVWVLEQLRRQGTSEPEILNAYPSLRLSDLANAWSYVASHRDEIDRNIRENEAA